MHFLDFSTAPFAPPVRGGAGLPMIQRILPDRRPPHLSNACARLPRQPSPFNHGARVRRGGGASTRSTPPFPSSLCLPLSRACSDSPQRLPTGVPSRKQPLKTPTQPRERTWRSYDERPSPLSLSCPLSSHRFSLYFSSLPLLRAGFRLPRSPHPPQGGRPRGLCPGAEGEAPPDVRQLPSPLSRAPITARQLACLFQLSSERFNHPWDRSVAAEGLAIGGIARDDSVLGSRLAGRARQCGARACFLARDRILLYFVLATKKRHPFLPYPSCCTSLSLSPTLSPTLPRFLTPSCSLPYTIPRPPSPSFALPRPPSPLFAARASSSSRRRTSPRPP